MKTILYIHGLSSSGALGTAKHLQSLLPDTHIIAPDLPIEPLEALELLHILVATEHPDLIIGTSMGGECSHNSFTTAKKSSSIQLFMYHAQCANRSTCVLFSIRERMVQRPIRLLLNYVIDTRKWNVTNSMG